jgi:hypothetical protein
VQEVGDVALVIIDPITAYMGAGKIDTHKTGMWGRCSRRCGTSPISTAPP